MLRTIRLNIALRLLRPYFEYAGIYAPDGEDADVVAAYFVNDEKFLNHIMNYGRE